MKSPNEFWLHLHELSSAYEAEGKTPQERSEAIVNQLRRMPSIARSEVLESFWLVAQNLPALYWASVEAHRQTQRPDAGRENVA